VSEGVTEWEAGTAYTYS